MKKQTEKTESQNNSRTAQTPPDSQKRKITSRQAVALAGVVLLVLLYLVMLAAAILDSSSTARWFRICLAATIVLPLLIWIYSWMYSRLTGKSAIGDPDRQEDRTDGAAPSGMPPSEKD